ncbi:hypothetical protein N7449_001993 [Penicillium cf. viridicatum]|uniref:MJ1316 RNA cyclic group end recognition domain-containing protein n=1 Tax=Penicillium cf. viridicatum TaxID=2972119 RepID=A0A9W9MU56_9EURO|nr:hypothetical protein N7449_001993 [Penicillium cf. viridicatum]
MASNNSNKTDAYMTTGQEASQFPPVSTISPRKRDQRSVRLNMTPRLAKTDYAQLEVDIFNRITWDSAFERSNYIIGFVDRFEGQLEITMGGWKKETTDEEFIPQHWVLYIRHTNGEIVWDRRRCIDKIFLSGNSAFNELAFLA